MRVVVVVFDVDETVFADRERGHEALAQRTKEDVLARQCVFSEGVGSEAGQNGGLERRVEGRRGGRSLRWVEVLFFPSFEVVLAEWRDDIRRQVLRLRVWERVSRGPLRVSLLQEDRKRLTFAANTARSSSPNGRK